MNGDIPNVIDLKVEGVDPADYPDFCDAYFSYGVWKDTGEVISEEDLDTLTEKHNDIVLEMSHESLQD